MFAIAGASNVYTYQPNIATFSTELVFKRTVKEDSYYIISLLSIKAETKSNFDFSLFLDKNNSVILHKINKQNTALQNSFYNYQRSYLNLLSLQSCIDLVA